MFDRRLGYVCLPRSFFDGPIFNGPNPRLRVALTCLQRANYKPGVLADGTLVPRGSFITSRENLARESGVTVQQGRGAISSLAKLNFLTHKTTNHFTMVTVTDYDLWQFSESPEQPADQPPEQPADNQQVTSGQPADNHNLIRESGNHSIKESSSSSSPEQSARPVERATTKTSPPIFSEEELETVRALMHRAVHGDGFTAADAAKPDRKITLETIAAAPGGVVELVVYFEDFPRRRLKPRGYGFFPTDLREMWPDRKRELEAEVAQENARVASVEVARLQHEDVEEKRRALHWACRNKGWKPIYSLDCAQCAGFGRIPSTEEVCTCAAGIEFTRLANLCPKCGESGYLIVGAWSKARWEWCDCQHAQKRRERNPDYMETLNAQLREAQAKIDRANGRATA